MMLSPKLVVLLGLGVLLSTLIATAFVVRFIVLRPLAKTARWLEELRNGAGNDPRVRGFPPMRGWFAPLCRDILSLAQSLGTARAAAQKEAELREAAESLWTPERLRAYVRRRLPDAALFVVSNREPYMHIRRGNAVDLLVPASGLVTALEPILRASNGTWIAHGSGNADR